MVRDIGFADVVLDPPNGKPLVLSVTTTFGTVLLGVLVLGLVLLVPASVVDGGDEVVSGTFFLTILWPTLSIIKYSSGLFITNTNSSSLSSLQYSVRLEFGLISACHSSLIKETGCNNGPVKACSTLCTAETNMECVINALDMSFSS